MKDCFDRGSGSRLDRGRRLAGAIGTAGAGSPEAAEADGAAGAATCAAWQRAPARPWQRERAGQREWPPAPPSAASASSTVAAAAFPGGWTARKSRVVQRPEPFA